MLRTGLPTCKALAARLVPALACIALVACYWSRYPEVMDTHLVVIAQFTRKVVALADDRRSVPIADWAEFVYPLGRARDFARVAAQRFPERASLASFDVVLERYGELVDDPLILSRPDAASLVRSRAAAVDAAIVTTREALEKEEAG